VDVQVRHRLAGIGTIINSYVIAGRLKFLVEIPLRRVKKSQYGCPFFIGSRKKRPHMSSGYYESMSRRHRKSIQYGDGEIVFDDNAILSYRAKGARFHVHSHLKVTYEPSQREFPVSVPDWNLSGGKRLAHIDW
jgi:hypothetical protein